jgi:hypothetical protein
MNDSSTGPDNWFYVQEGRRQGPLSLTLLVRELLALDAPEGVLVWRSGLPAWTKAGLVEELRRQLPPPVPGSLPLPVVEPERDVPDLPESAPREGEAEGGEASSEDRLVSDGDLVPEPGEAGAPSPEGPPSRRRRRRQRSSHQAKASWLYSYALPLVLLFLAVMIGLWLLLRRINEVPPGRIIQQGDLSGWRSGARPG